jgi:hypothetical protein
MPRNGSEPISTVRKKVTLTHDFVTCSHHEAGHVVYGLLHFMMIYSAYVFMHKQHKRVEGYTQYYSPYFTEIQDPTLLSERVRAEIGLSYAGMMAEKYQNKLYSGIDDFPACIYGYGEDQREAHDLIVKHNMAPPGRKRYNYKKKMMRQVSRELQEHWDAVTIVAHAMFRKKRLSYDKLRTLLTTKTDNKEFWKERFRAISHYYDNEKSLTEQDFMSMISK